MAAIHNPGPRAGHGIALKSVAKHVTEGGGGGVFATLNVVPMIDMMIILVVFLIQQFSASGELLAQNKDTAMPTANSPVQLERALIITLTRTTGSDGGQVLLENEFIVGLSDVNETKFPSWDIKPLADRLKKEWTLQKQRNKQSTPPKKPNRKIIIQADRSVPFRAIKMVMATCGRNEYREPNFAVTQDSGPATGGEEKGE